MRAISLPSIVIGVALLLSAGCARQVDRVVLLPSADGGSGKLVTSSALRNRAAQVSRSNEVLEAEADSLVKPGTATDAAVQKRYSKLLAAEPPRPKRYLLYFLPGNSELTPESERVLQTVKNLLGEMPAADFVVIGHTDRVGTLESNDALSIERARFVRARLIAEGIPENRVEAAGRGEREPLVQTADEVAEPRNRRVEIKVR